MNCFCSAIKNDIFLRIDFFVCEVCERRILNTNYTTVLFLRNKDKTFHENNILKN